MQKKFEKLLKKYEKQKNIISSPSKILFIPVLKFSLQFTANLLKICLIPFI